MERDIRFQGWSAWGWVRRQVFATWRGADYVTVVDSGKRRYYGTRLLSLDVRHEPEEFRLQLESRTIYQCVDETKSGSFALLRSVAWNERFAKEAARADPLYHRVRMPAKFVLVQNSVVQSWISTIGETKTALPVMVHAEDSIATIRRLRLEPDYVANTVELVWPLDHFSGAEALNGTWEAIWVGMEDQLSSSPVPSEVYEDFDHLLDPPQFQYRFA